MPTLRTGFEKPDEVPGVLDLVLAGRFVADGYEVLEASATSSLAEANVAVDVPAGRPSPFAFSTRSGYPTLGRPAVPAAVWVRRPVSDAPVTGELFIPGSTAAHGPGQHRRFRIRDTAVTASDPDVGRLWLLALAERLHEEGPSAWSNFVRARLWALSDSWATRPGATSTRTTRAARTPAVRADAVARGTAPRDDLARFMETTTGTAAVQEALQADRPLLALVAEEPLTIPVTTLAVPALAHHPWARMTAHLGAPPAEALASDAPADFYYVRAKDLTTLLHLLDEVDDWGTSAARAVSGMAEDRALGERYETQLALRRAPLTRALGPAVIGEVAIVGSDPYVQEGSDVTLLLRVKSRPLLDVALEGTLNELEATHGKLARETRTRAGVKVSVARSVDGSVAQQRAMVGDLEVVSNSPHAIDAVLDTMAGRRARLADEPDFRFMLARDRAVRADVLAYMGDRFVAEVVGPRQKVLEARREIALGELETPGFAALLYGAVEGKSPASVDALLATGLLSGEDLRHADGARVAWRPGSAARSPWGTPAAMTPLIDLPAPTRVRASEKAGYERFAHSYQERWAAYIDPVAVRLAFDGRAVKADLRVLPLIDGTEYRDIASFVGAAAFTTADIDGGARLVLGIGKDSDVRRMLTRRVRSVAGDGFSFDFLGDWAAIGVLDRSAVAEAFLAFSEDRAALPQTRHHPSGTGDRFEVLARLPLYAEVAVKSGAEAALALAAVRVMANETIPGMFEWGEVARHRGVPVVAVALKKSLARGLAGDGPDLTIYYAVTEGALIVSLQRWVLEQRIDDQLDGTAPRGIPLTEAGAAQLSFELASEHGRPIASVVSWLLEAEQRAQGRASRATAEALFRGAPELARDPRRVRALGLAYFGGAPVTPDGAAYVAAREGAKDPATGTPFAPVWPSLPVAGSPVAKLAGVLSNVRADLSFDDEGNDDAGKPMRSLHVRAALGGR